MDEAVRELRRDWIRRVLHVDLAGPAGTPVAPDLVGLWWDTKDMVSAQIEDLRRSLMATGHPLASAACEAGLGGFTGGFLARFQAALLDYNQATPDTRVAAATRLSKIGADLRSFITSNTTLPILERNPFGVRVTIRTEVPRTIDSILRQMPH